MFATVLKGNPYHGKDGRFTTKVKAKRVVKPKNPSALGVESGKGKTTKTQKAGSLASVLGLV